MKYNNKLKLDEYLQVIDDMVDVYFDHTTYEYTPQYGELFAVCTYFNYCVELEESDTIKKQPIIEFDDIKLLYENEDFMKHYNEAIDCFDAVQSNLTFGHAYEMVQDIVNYKRNDANSFANAISAGMSAILKSFRESFTEEEVNKISEIAKDIVSGKISNESIVKAYENSDRFKSNTETMSVSTTPAIVKVPVNKEK